MRTGTIGRAGAVLTVWTALAMGTAPAQEVHPAQASAPGLVDDGWTSTRDGGQPEAAPLAQDVNPLPPSPAEVLGDGPFLYRAQNMDASPGYAPPDPMTPFPLFSTHPEQGGFFTAGSFVMYRQTNPTSTQRIAVRGFVPVDNSTGNPAGHLVGSGQTALDAQQVSGPNEYSPGFKLEFGWKFDDSSALTVSWMYLDHKKLTASASVVPLNFNVGPGFENSFLTAFVENVTPLFSGPANKVASLGGAAASPSAAFGIWNAASEMSIEFDQRTQEWEATYRWTVYDTECYRLSGLVGPRFFWIWERFKWRTVDFPGDGSDPTPLDVGIYTNIVSNRMYGVHAGCEQEWYWGHGFACMCDLQALGFMDIVKERVRYELGEKFRGGVAKKSETIWQAVPGAQATIALMYYPIEGVELKIGYDFIGFLNTIGMNEPVVFDFSGLNPKYNNQARIYDGFMATLSISF